MFIFLSFPSFLLFCSLPPETSLEAEGGIFSSSLSETVEVVPYSLDREFISFDWGV